MSEQAAIIEGDCLAVLPTLDAGSVDAVVTDPPYGLSFMGKDWDHGIPGEAFWAEALRAAKPGAHLLAFGGTRTFHRLTCAIEDSGWEIRDCLMWLYGQGFPKSRGCLKPAWEPIIMARKPAPCPVLNIEACRIGTAKGVPRTRADGKTRNTYNGGWKDGGALGVGGKDPALGRWPCNVVLDTSVAEHLDAEIGDRHSDYERGGPSRYFYRTKPRAGERGEGNDHPTVKPVALMRWLVRLVTPPGGLVLDPFAGSGSTGVASIAEGRRFIGIERDAGYCEIARRRIAEAEAQGSLFGAAP